MISHPITIDLFHGLAELEDTGRGWRCVRPRP